jgi:hypothetical protein
MTVLVVLTVLEIVVLIAALAFYLFWVGTLLARIAGNLEECAEIVRGIVADAALIGPGVEHINETGGVVAGALPLLYGMAEEIVADVTPRPEPPAVPEPARPASGTRRSRLLDAVGFAPRLYRTEGGAPLQAATAPPARLPSPARPLSLQARHADWAIDTLSCVAPNAYCYGSVRVVGVTVSVLAGVEEGGQGGEGFVGSHDKAPHREISR